MRKKLKLKVNRDKSTVDRPWKLKFLVYSFYSGKGGYRIRVRKKLITKLKAKLRETTSKK